MTPDGCTPDGYTPDFPQDPHEPKHPGGDPQVSVYAESDTEILTPGIRLIVVGYTHRTAPLSVRSRFTISRDELPVLARRFKALPGISGCVLLATCNRLEAYLCIRSEAEAEAAFVDLVGGQDLEGRAVLARSLMVHSGDEAVRHLFRVASGLDAMVLGDGQILGQTKEAYRNSCAQGHAGPMLHKACHAAFRCAKDVQKRTTLGGGASSVAGAAISLLAERLVNLRGRKVLIVGVNRMTELAARRLRKAQVGELLICNRTAERAREMAAEFSATTVDWENLMEGVAVADIVITCTGATEPILTQRDLDDALAGRPERGLTVVDMAVPPDVSRARPTTSPDSAVEIIDLEDVGAYQKRAEERRCEAAAAGEKIVGRQVKSFADWLNNQRLGPHMRRLREEADRSLEKELTRRFGEQDSDQRQQYFEFGHTLIKRFLGAHRRVEDEK